MWPIRSDGWWSTDRLIERTESVPICPLRCRVNSLAALTAFTLTVAACGSSESHATSPPAPPVPRMTSDQLGLVPPAPGLSDRLVFAAHHVAVGRTLKGNLVVTNHTARPINLNQGCGPYWAVGLVGSKVAQSPAFTSACSLRPLFMQPGVNRFPVTADTTYVGAGSAGPLPPGTYYAFLFGSGNLSLPEPEPVLIHVTARP